MRASLPKDKLWIPSDLQKKLFYFIHSFKCSYVNIWKFEKQIQYCLAYKMLWKVSILVYFCGFFYFVVPEKKPAGVGPGLRFLDKKFCHRIVDL